MLAVARRKDRLNELSDEGIDTFVCDVTADDEVVKLRRYAEDTGGVRTLINNAGGAVGMDSVETGAVDDWRAMFEVNVIAAKRMISEFLPLLRHAAGQWVAPTSSP